MKRHVASGYLRVADTLADLAETIGEYPGAGGQIGPAMTFGYLAALHAASEG